jgi:Ferroportin1 (FPN1)
MHPDAVTREVAYSLYLCHLLTMWNARTYEFSAVLFAAAAFPESLVASSVLYCNPPRIILVSLGVKAII